MILALAATIVIVNAPPPRNNARDAASAFTNALRTAVDDGIITGAGWRAEITANEWQILRRSNGEWVTATQSDGRSAGEIIIRIKIDDAAIANEQNQNIEFSNKKPGPNNLVIVPIDPFGETPGFTAFFESGGEVWAVTHRPDGVIETRRQ